MSRVTLLIIIQAGSFAYKVSFQYYIINLSHTSSSPILSQTKLQSCNIFLFNPNQTININKSVLPLSKPHYQIIILSPLENISSNNKKSSFHTFSTLSYFNLLPSKCLPELNYFKPHNYLMNGLASE